MPDYAGAVAAIRAKLEAEWTATPLGFVNDAKPLILDGQGRSVPWVLAEIVSAGPPTLYAGSPGNRVKVHDGLIQGHVFVPVASGTDDALQLAVSFGEVFANAEFYKSTPGHCVRTIEPWIDGGGAGDENGRWWRVTATVPFEYWGRG